MNTSKLFFVGAVFLLLAACSREEPAPVTDDSAPDADEPAGVETEPLTDEETPDDVPVVVEESAAEPEDTGEEPIVLAQTQTKPVRTDWKFSEGQHYVRMVPTQPTLGGADKIEVAEFFWYGCGHCYNFEPAINGWAKDAPPNVRFVRIPGMWNNVLKIHAQLFYTEEVLIRNGKIEDAEGFRASVFEEYHRRNNRLLNAETIARHFARFGVSGEDFQKTWESFEVAQKLRVADDLARRYSIASVPAIVVNGKYRTGGAEAGGYPQLLEVIDELVEKESIR
ncbi:MAG: thiol:disulfide interchange protein DsbA/DsbL [Woeseiaceae bacterium]